MKLHYAVSTALALALASAAPAATPDQVGTWVGSIKSKVRTPASTTSVKSDMQLEIAADDSTTVTIGGVVQDSDGFFAAGEAIVLFGNSGPPNSTVTYCALHFKGTKAKGASSGVTISPTTDLLEAFSGKLSLKKQ